MNRCHFFAALNILFVASIGRVSGQPVTPADELMYTLEEFVLPGGRAGNNVNDIVQGPYGFVWFGSHGGLHRYDGYQFVTYKNDPADTVGETTSLTYPYVEGLFWDSKNYLWVATYGGGLYLFDPRTDTFKHFAHDPNDSSTISHHRVNCAIEDSDGQLWFGTANGLNRLAPDGETFIRYYADRTNEAALQDDDIRKLYVDREGTLWLGTGMAGFVTGGGGFSRYNRDSDTFTTYLHDPSDETSIWTSAVRGILEDSQGNFWLGTGEGLNKMDRSSGTFQRMHPGSGTPFAPTGERMQGDPIVYSLLEDQTGGLWVGTVQNSAANTHLIRFDQKTDERQVMPMQSSAWDMLESSDGTLWVAGAGVSGKVMKITPNEKAYNLTAGSFFVPLLRSEIGKTFEQNFQLIGPIDMTMDSRNNDIWASFVVISEATNHAVLLRYNEQDNIMDFRLLSDLNVNRDVYDRANNFGSVGMFVDKNGLIWGTYASEHVGIYSFDPKSNEVTEYRHDPNDSTSISSNGVITMILDSRGEIWAATYDRGLNRLNPETGQIRHYHFNQYTYNDQDSPIALMEDLDGNIWMAGDLLTEDYLLTIFILDPRTDEIRMIEDNNSNVFSQVHTMAQSKVTGSVWFGLTNNGLGTYDPVNDYFYYVNTTNGLFPFDNVATVLVDNSGILWTADTDLGTLVRIEEPMNFYSIQEASRAGAIWRAGISAPDGKIYFLNGLENVGLTVIDPQEIRPDVAIGTQEVRLIDLQVLGEKQEPGQGGVLSKPLWLTEGIELPASSRSFAISFSDFNFQEEDPVFGFRLLPYETSWRRNDNSLTANYHQVPPGEYQFELKSMKTGNAYENRASLAITILPPWWQTWWAYGIYALIFVGGVFAVDRVQRRRLLQKERERTKDRELLQAREIEKAYHQLKETQTQLIHSEKMASLGELTAGIAHEIQNPLNFVNNFSEINREMLSELREAVSQNDQAEIGAILKDLEDNEEKVTHHGKRAEHIVKSMLQHSRTGSGEKELTDINALCDEYLRLAYHGFRAKDQSFNAEFKLELDPNLPKINVVPQDIGRVLLNLINNGFQAVSSKLKAESEGQYNPIVTVTTQHRGGRVQITVSDNGPGIPDAIKDKIFQPFFTTKPTGEGTGLGLSMSYDIVTKGHGGTLEVQSEGSKGTSMKLLIPFK